MLEGLLLAHLGPVHADALELERVVAVVGAGRGGGGVAGLGVGAVAAAAAAVVVRWSGVVRVVVGVVRVVAVFWGRDKNG